MSEWATDTIKDLRERLRITAGERDEARAQRDRLEGVLTARHGGEPKELLREVDDTREHVRTLEEHVVELNRELAEAVKRYEGFRDAYTSEREAITDEEAKIATRQVAALREQLQRARDWIFADPRHAPYVSSGEMDAVLADTEPTAREHDARVTRAALERAAKTQCTECRRGVPRVDNDTHHREASGFESICRARSILRLEDEP